MLKKSLLLVITLGLLIISCSSDPDPRDNYPQNLDITFSVSSSDNDRLSDITFNIEGEGISISDFSSSASHLPINKDYLNKSIPYFTTLGITYRDNSGGEVGIPFEPYNIVLIIRVDSEIKAEKEITITESGTTDFVIFKFD